MECGRCDGHGRVGDRIHEFARGVHHVPSEAELSRFVYWDGLAGGVNHMWIGPLLGVTVGGIAAVVGKHLRRSDERAQ
jgi:hypothetical protein